MRLDRILAIAKKNLRSLKHDRRTAGFLVAMPLLMITIFGYTFGGDVTNLDVYVINLDSAPADESIATAIIASLASRDTMDIVRSFGPQDNGALALGEQKVRDAKQKYE